jgi:hypothetical protein
MEFNIIDEEELKYIVNVDDDGDVSMRYSKSSIWSTGTRGNHIGSLEDTGNDIKIKLDGKELTLDYHEFLQLKLLMDIKVEIDDNL